jgi:hypothetical protein
MIPYRSSAYSNNTIVSKNPVTSTNIGDGSNTNTHTALRNICECLGVRRIAKLIGFLNPAQTNHQPTTQDDQPPKNLESISGVKKDKPTTLDKNLTEESATKTQQFWRQCNNPESNEISASITKQSAINLSQDNASTSYLKENINEVVNEPQMALKFSSFNIVSMLRSSNCDITVQCVTKTNYELLANEMEKDTAYLMMDNIIDLTNNHGPSDVYYNISLIYQGKKIGKMAIALNEHGKGLKVSSVDNVTINQDNAIKGVGTALMELAAKVSSDLGQSGKIYLIATDGILLGSDDTPRGNAIFYTKLGMHRSEPGSTEFQFDSLRDNDTVLGRLFYAK